MVDVLTMRAAIAGMVTAMEGVTDTEIGGDGFAEIRASQSVFSKDYGKLKRVPLPIVINEPEEDWRDVPLAAALMFAGLLGLIRSIQFPALAILGLVAGAGGGLVIARIFARQRLGAGTVSIEAAGFRDSRIGPDLISWSACERYTFVVDRMGRQTPGVHVHMRRDAILPHISSTYRWAFGIIPRKARLVLYIELKGAGYTEDLVDVVGYLVKKHGGTG